MKKILKYFFLVSIAIILLATGCSRSKTQTEIDFKPGSEAHPNQVPKAAPKEDPSHITLTKNKITFSVSKKPKYFDKNMIVPEEGKVVAGLFIAITNDTQEDLLIDPKFVEITTDDGGKHGYSETKTSITGKGAFKIMALPPTYRGGGLLLFEIKDKAEIQSVKYDDHKGHIFNVTLSEPSKKV